MLQVHDVGLDVTWRCNLRCPHCLLPLEERRDGKKDFNPERFAELLPGLVKHGCRSIRFTGGEPLLHPRFKDIYLLAKRAGLDTTVFTNGTCLDPEWIGFFLRYPLRRLIITVYGASDEEYSRNSFQHTPGMFSRLSRTIEELSGTRIPYVLQCFIQKDKTDLKERFMRTLKKKENVAQGIWVYPRITGDTSNMKTMPAPDGWKNIPDYRKIRQFLFSDERSRSRLADSGVVMGCGIGHRSIHIRADYKVTPCIFYSDITFDLQESSLDEILHNRLPRALARKIPVSSPCYNCGLHKDCPRCAAMGYGTIGTNPQRELLCEYARRISDNDAC